MARAIVNIFAYLVCLACLASVAVADDRPSSSLSGRVTDVKTGAPIANARVHVRDAAGHERVVVTDGAGRYTVELAPGAYDVTAELGASTARGRVSLEAGQSTVLDAQLTSRPVQALTGAVTDGIGGPVEHARVRVSDAAGREVVTTTDAGGRYTVELGPGDYDVAIERDQFISRGRVSIAPGQSTVLNTELESLPGEVIEIHDRPPPKVMPRPTNFSRIKAPPYSDEALAKDAWTRAWMLLDIGADGTVKRFKFLKRPGYDLDKIAAAEVFKLRFTPARDHDDRPIATEIVWGIEWPSNGWLRTFLGTRTRLPSVKGFPPRSEAASVPCRGSGPMLLGSVYPTYRDCTGPDTSKAASEAWITRP